MPAPRELGEIVWGIVISLNGLTSVLKKNVREREQKLVNRQKYKDTNCQTKLKQTLRWFNIIYMEHNARNPKEYNLLMLYLK